MNSERIEICQWRVCQAQPSGLLVWFDPETEVVRLYARDPMEPSEGSGVVASSERDDPDEYCSSHIELNQILMFEDLP